MRTKGSGGDDALRGECYVSRGAGFSNTAADPSRPLRLVVARGVSEAKKGLSLFAGTLLGSVFVIGRAAGYCEEENIDQRAMLGPKSRRHALFKLTTIDFCYFRCVFRRNVTFHRKKNNSHCDSCQEQCCQLKILFRNLGINGTLVWTKS